MINNLISLTDITIYDILELRQKVFQDLDFCIDVGAAAGIFSQKILQINPNCKIYAYEPFPGNFPHLEKNLSNYHNVKIIKKALSNKKEKKKFYVSSVVEDGNKSFAHDMIGYSSVGTFYGNEDQAKFVLDVECTTVDEEIKNHKINFCKMDVQGAELSVLEGAVNTIMQTGIEIIFMEFSFQPYILNFLRNFNYVLFDTDYIFTSQANIDDLLKAGFRNIERITLSTDALAYKATYQGSYDYLASSAFRNQFKIGWLQTDLICVDINYLEKFMLLLSIKLGSNILTSLKLENFLDIIKETDKKNLLIELNITEFNLIIFPDWQQDEKDLISDLGNIINQIANSLNNQNITLLIDVYGCDIEQAEILVSEIIMNFLLEQNLYISDQLNISFLTELTSNQIEFLRPYINGRLALINENKKVIEKFNIPIFNLDKLNKKGE